MGGAPSVDVRGDEQLERLYRRIRDVGDNELRKELLRGIRVAVKPLPAAIKGAARSDLPSRGGLAGQMGRASISSRTRTASSKHGEAGVRLIGQKERESSKTARKGKKGNARPPSRYIDIASLDRGRLRHPLFGNRSHWYEQQIKPGFWTQTINRRADDVERDVVQAMDNIAAKITAD